jgi:death on curing protein
VREPEWLIKPLVLALHEEQLAEHGGPPGLRDEGLLDSALDRPRNRFHYDNPDLFDLAAAYAYGIARNHPFIDGNKRTAFVVMETFLALNGFDFPVADETILPIWLDLASGALSEADLAHWIRQNAVKSSD